MALIQQGSIKCQSQTFFNQTRGQLKTISTRKFFFNFKRKKNTSDDPEKNLKKKSKSASIFSICITHKFLTQKMSIFQIRFEIYFKVKKKNKFAINK